MDREGIFVQKIEHEGEGLDLSFLVSLSLVETLDLSGPKLIMRFRDPESILRDDMGVGPGSELRVTYADYWHEEGDEAVDRFTVLTMPDDGDTVTLNCMQADVWDLKKPAVRASMWVRQPVATIIRQCIPARQAVGRFAVRQDYHVLPGERPAKMLRQLAREIGAHIYYLRGVVYARRLSAMNAAEPLLTLGYNDTRADYPIIHYNRPNAEALFSDAADRRYCGWNMVSGPIWARTLPAAAVEFSSAESAAVLDNLADTLRTDIDLVVSGMGQIRPGVVLELSWNLDRVDQPIDESLPERVVVRAAAHHYQAQKYLTRIKGVAP
ncbi:MAG: hypothetical protein ABIL58_23335 [Pseudomonadota bacterium]